MTRITVRDDLGGFDNDRIKGGGHILDIFLDGVEQRFVETVDDERGFVDVIQSGNNRHRLFGKIELRWRERKA